MNIVSRQIERPRGTDWLDQLFSAKTVARGGAVRRNIADVEREVGRAALELEVHRRGFHLLDCGPHFVVICSTAPVKIVC